MSLAMFAASFDDNSNITLPNNSDNNDNIINQKRHKKTQRKYPKIENFDTNKVNSVLQKIHENSNDDSDNDSGDDFKLLLPPPESMGVSKTIPMKQESFPPLGNGNKYVGRAPSAIYQGDDNLDLNDYNNYGNEKTVEEYYKRVLPGHNNNNSNRNNNGNNNFNGNNNYSNTYASNQYPTQDLLLQKLNYMISLLEDKQDEKTNNVTEEVVLYSFLGIFIIFIADSFVRVGKYVR